MKRFISFPKLRNFAVGIWFWVAINNMVKYTIYPFIAISVKDKLWLEILLIFTVSSIIRLIMILVYDYFKIDFFLIEEMKQNKGITNRKNHITKKIISIKKRWNKFFILGLTIFDPFIAVIYIRPDYFKWDGFEGTKTKIVFLLSNLIAAITVTLGFNFLFYLLTKAGF